MVEIIARVDINGWASRERGQKWQMQTGRRYIIDEDKAREFVAKRYASFADPEYARRHPITRDEELEQLSQVTTLTLSQNGDQNDG
jgi:hypothetical protein